MKQIFRRTVEYTNMAGTEEIYTHMLYTLLFLSREIYNLYYERNRSGSNESWVRVPPAEMLSYRY